MAWPPRETKQRWPSGGSPSAVPCLLAVMGQRGIWYYMEPRSFVVQARTIQQKKHTHSQQPGQGGGPPATKKQNNPFILLLWRREREREGIQERTSQGINGRKALWTALKQPTSVLPEGPLNPFWKRSPNTAPARDISRPLAGCIVGGLWCVGRGNWVKAMLD